MDGRGRYPALATRARWIAAALLVALGIWTATVTATADAAGARAAGIAPGTEFTPMVSSVVTRPTPVKATDGRFHIAYELVLTNAAPMAMAVQRVEVRDGRTRRVLARLSGRNLTANMNPVAGVPEAAPAGAATTMAASGTSIVWLDVTVPSGTALPRVLEHRVVAASRPPARPFTFNGVVGRFDTGRASVVLGPPVRPGTWVADEGCCTNPTHHRRGLAPVDGVLAVPQRFAIDWFLLDDQFRAWIGDPRQLTSYPSYRQPLIAAAAGTVVRTLDGVRENQPQGTLPELPPIGETVGNHVTLRVAPGVYLLYAHMTPGSVRVRVGQRVRRGQIVGLLGNSGNSSTPHLHFQVMTRPTFFPTDSVPYVFDRFDFMGQITTEFTDEDLALRRTGALAFAPSRAAGERRREMPLDRNVVRFR